MSMTPEERMAAAGITLPPVAQPVANYLPYRLVNGLLFVSGQGPRRADGSFSTGKVGRTVSIEQAYADARQTGLQIIAIAKLALGDLSRVRCVAKVLGMVNCDGDFGDHPKVINGCSDVFVEVFGEAGRHARSAVGMGSLPQQITVEVEAIFEVA